MSCIVIHGAFGQLAAGKVIDQQPKELYVVPGRQQGWLWTAELWVLNEDGRAVAVNDATWEPAKEGA